VGMGRQATWGWMAYMRALGTWRGRAARDFNRGFCAATGGLQQHLHDHCRHAGLKIRSGRLGAGMGEGRERFLRDGGVGVQATGPAGCGYGSVEHGWLGAETG
jgi:hypothetical protein